MLFKVRDEIIDTEKVPVAIVFADSEERNRFIEIVIGIKKNENNPEPEYWFSYHPKNYFTRETFDAWASLTDEERTKMGKLKDKPGLEL